VVRELRHAGHAGHAETAAEEPHLLHADITAPILDSFRFLYKEWGYGFLESPYRRGLVIELGLRGLSVKEEVPFDIVHRGIVIGRYRADMVVEEGVLVEVKATKSLTTADERQLLNYLKASRLQAGLILHFGPVPRCVRRVLSRP
jgi:GxxExxY protein